MTYTVKYKKLNTFFWNKLKKVKGDGLLETKTHRFFILEDESRVEIPLENVIFTFDQNRYLSIKKKMDIEAGQVLVTR